ncbi:MAG: hypothetical protein S4CHLAM7_12850 [Chlamydiae bacterium]|nr:hypothetical protein [Chlamydiota bacterium]
MKTSAKVVLAYATLVLLGGMLGCFIAGSIPSLIAGVTFGVLIAFNGIKMLKGNPKGQQLALIQAIILGSFFVYRYQTTQKAMPAIPMIIVSFSMALFLLLRMPKRQSSEKKM